MDYALAAFEALIQSGRMDPAYKINPFSYYEIALWRLHALLYKLPDEMTMWVWQGAFATALQLATFDALSLPQYTTDFSGFLVTWTNALNMSKGQQGSLDRILTTTSSSLLPSSAVPSSNGTRS